MQSCQMGSIALYKAGILQAETCDFRGDLTAQIGDSATETLHQHDHKSCPGQMLKLNSCSCWMSCITVQACLQTDPVAKHCLSVRAQCCLARCRQFVA